MTKLTVTSPGSVGELQAGWSVSEQATPVAIGESAGSVGSAKLSAGRTSTSEFVGGSAVEIDHDELGSWYGDITSVTTQGQLGVSLDAAGVASALVAEAIAKPFVSGSPISEFVFPTQTYGYPTGLTIDSSGNSYIYSHIPLSAAPTTSYITKWSPTGKFLGLITDSLPGGGGNNGETGSGIQSKFLTLDPTEQFIYFKRDTGTNLIQKITIAGVYVTGFGTSGGGNGQTLVGGPGGMECAANGNLYLADNQNNRVQVFDSSGTYVTKWGTVGAATGQFQSTSLVDLALDDSTQVYTLEGKSSSTERVQIFTSTGTFVSSFNLPAAVLNANSISVNSTGTEIYVQGKASTNEPRIFVFDAAGTLLTSWAGGGNHDPSIVPIANGMHWKKGKLYYRTFSAGAEYIPRGGDRIMTAVPYPTLRAAFSYYLNFLMPSMQLTYAATSNPIVALPGWSGSVWPRIRDLAAAYGLEVSVVGGVLTVRDSGSTSLTIAGNERPVTLSAESRGGARNLVIKYQNTQSGDALTMFTATAIQTLQILETRSATFQTTAHPLTLNAPTPTDATTATPGTYHVQDYNGLDVPAAAWTYWGGAVTPAVGDVPGQIRITFQGPKGIIPGYTAPFSLASGTGTSRTPQLIITGRGVTVDPKSITTGTGADPSQAATTVGATIDNFAISTLAQATSRGSWARTLATGTDVEISFDMLVSRLAGFGLDVGSIIPFNSSYYRITDISYGNVRAQVTAHRHVTFGNVKSAIGNTLLATNYSWNPSFESNITGYAERSNPGNVYTPTWSSAQAHHGSRSLLISASSGNNGGGVVFDINPPVQRVGGETIEASYWVYPNTTKLIRPRIYTYQTPNGTGTATSVDGVDVSCPLATWTKLTISTTLAAGVQSYVPTVRTDGFSLFAGSLTALHVDEVSNGNVGQTFFTGSSAAAGELFAWNGPTNNAPSRRFSGTWTNAMVKALWSGYTNADVKVKPLRTS